ncbi:hypothetical protein MP638_007249 [Amoeboaphelidium occidentale]|nr:hypothetical protein MP638_007249 [Amoeboaphelidium occidentale]
MEENKENFDSLSYADKSYGRKGVGHVGVLKDMTSLVELNPESSKDAILRQELAKRVSFPMDYKEMPKSWFFDIFDENLSAEDDHVSELKQLSLHPDRKRRRVSLSI